VSAFTVDHGIDERGRSGEVRSASAWAQVRGMAAEGASQRGIAERLGINRRTVARMLAADEPPRYSRAPVGSMLDPLDGVLQRLVDAWPEINAPRVTAILRQNHGYAGSVDLVRKRLARLRPSRPARRAGYRPGAVLHVDWCEMPSRPRIGDSERRVYALVATLPYSGAQTAHFSFDLTIESLLEGHVRVFDWLGGVVRECVYEDVQSAAACRGGDQVTRRQPFLALCGHYALRATSRIPMTSLAGSVESGVRQLRSDFWPARRFGSFGDLEEQYGNWRDRIFNRRRHTTGGFAVADRLAHEREVLRPLPRTGFDFAGARPFRVPQHGYAMFAGNFYRAPLGLVQQPVLLRFDRDEVWIVDRGRTVARYCRCYERGRSFCPQVEHFSVPESGAAFGSC
jgi:transposase